MVYGHGDFYFFGEAAAGADELGVEDFVISVVGGIGDLWRAVSQRHCFTYIFAELRRELGAARCLRRCQVRVIALYLSVAGGDSALVVSVDARHLGAVLSFGFLPARLEGGSFLVFVFDC